MWGGTFWTRTLLFLAIVGLAFAVALTCTMSIETAKADNPPDPRYPPQQNPDQFEYCPTSTTCINLDAYNKFSLGLRQTAEWRWTFQRNPACPGDLRPLVLQAISDIQGKTPIRLIEDTTDGNVIYQSCGQELISKCGGTGINCLPDSYPYSMKIYLSSDLTTYFTTTAISIILHELFGHAFCTWDEQYVKDGNFSNSTDQTIMNTGPNSRHLLGQLELDRFWRTCGTRELTNLGYGFNGAWYVYACGLNDQGHKTGTRISVLVDRHDGRGVVWTGVIVSAALNPPSLLIGRRGDANGCVGIGSQEGLRIEIGAVYYLKDENAAAWPFKTEVKVPNLP